MEVKKLYFSEAACDMRYDLMGRRKLTATPPSGPLDKSAVADILNNISQCQDKNSNEADYLYWFYRGYQPVLSRTKEIRSEINNKIPENRALEIVEFKKGYEFSHPIQYTNAGTESTAPVNVLNDYARLDGKEAKDLELAEWMYIAGSGYRLVLPNENTSIDDAPYFTESLDPRNAFVVYSTESGGKAIVAGKRVKQKIKKNNQSFEDQWVYGVYTENDYFEWILPSPYGVFTGAPSERDRRHAIGMLPIVEYPLNESRLGYVEMCLHLYNAINNLNSNRIDAIEQFVQAYLVFLNCQLPEVDGVKIVPKVGDAIEIPPSTQGNADVKFIYAQLDQNHTQITKEDLLSAIYEICGVPDRNSRSGGGDTGQAVVLRNGWGTAEARAKSTEKLFKRSESDVLKLILRICRDTTSAASEIGDLSLRDIDIKFTRNRSDNMQVKSQTLDTLINKCNIHPEDAIEYCELFSDPSAVWLKSQAWKEEKQKELDDKMEEQALIEQPPDEVIETISVEE